MTTLHTPVQVGFQGIQEDALQILRKVFSSLQDALEAFSPPFAKMLTAVVTTTLGAGFLSFQLGGKKPAAHALYTLVASSIIGLLWIARKYGADHLPNQIIRLARGGLSAAQRGGVIDRFATTLATKAEEGLYTHGRPHLVRPGGVALLLIPQWIAEISDTGASYDDPAGAMKIANLAIWENQGMCSRRAWTAACAEFTKQCNTWIQIHEDNEIPEVMPLLASIQFGVEPDKIPRRNPDNLEASETKRHNFKVEPQGLLLPTAQALIFPENGTPANTEFANAVVTLHTAAAMILSEHNIRWDPKVEVILGILHAKIVPDTDT